MRRLKRSTNVNVMADPQLNRMYNKSKTGEMLKQPLDVNIIDDPRLLKLYERSKTKLDSTQFKTNRSIRNENVDDVE